MGKFKAQRPQSSASSHDGGMKKYPGGKVTGVIRDLVAASSMDGSRNRHSKAEQNQTLAERWRESAGGMTNSLEQRGKRGCSPRVQSSCHYISEKCIKKGKKNFFLGVWGGNCDMQLLTGGGQGT